jgi:hypothetical protein
LKQPFFLAVSTIRSEGVWWIVAREQLIKRIGCGLVARWNCPHDCPCDAPKQRIRSQHQPARSIGEVENSEGFTRKIEVGREARFRLANRPLQPLGHLTAEEFLSINDIAVYAKPIVPMIVPEIVPASPVAAAAVAVETLSQSVPK